MQDLLQLNETSVDKTSRHITSMEVKQSIGTTPHIRIRKTFYVILSFEIFGFYKI